MSFDKEVSKQEQKQKDRLESINSSDATFPINDSFGRNVSSCNNIQNILNLYTKEIQREKNREPSTNSFKISENLLRGLEGNSDNIYINSLATLSNLIPSDHDENITVSPLEEGNANVFEEDGNTYADNKRNQQIQERMNTLTKEHEANFVKMNLENLTDSRNDSRELDSSVLHYACEQEESPHYIIYNGQDSEKDSNEYVMYMPQEYNIHYSKNIQSGKEQLGQQYKTQEPNIHRNLPYNIHPKEQYTYEQNSVAKEDCHMYPTNEKYFIEAPQKHKIPNQMNSEYSIDPFEKTRRFVAQDLAIFPHSNDHCSNSNYESIDIYHVEKENEVPLDYSTVTCESLTKNNVESNGMYSSGPKEGNFYVKKPKYKYQTLIEFMDDQSHGKNLKINKKNSNESFEIKTAISLKNRLEKDTIKEQNIKKLQRYHSDNNEVSTEKKEVLSKKPKSYSLEDMKNGKIEIPNTIFVPLSFNVPGDNIMDCYERNKKLEKFMQDCNNSTSLILKYPLVEKKQPSSTLNMPVSMASIVNNNIGVPIIYDDDFDREQYHPNVKNLHVGSIFERHVFNILKNKKDLGKKVYSESEKFKKYNYDQENGFWISNISKDRLVNPEKNNSYITELVYEKNKSYQEEMEMLTKCKNYKEIVPSIHEIYRYNNFYKFLLKENLCPPHLNPDIATIMRRYDVEKISSHKIISETPGITPYVNNVNE